MTSIKLNTPYKTSIKSCNICFHPDVSGFAEALQGELRGTTEEPTQDSGSGQKETEERDTPDGDERDSGSNQ